MSTIQVEAPIWLSEIVAEIGELGRLEENWDSYGGKRVDPCCIEAAVSLLRSVLDAATSKPSVVPTSRGGIQLEWHRGGIDLEVEIESPPRMNVSFADEQEGVQEELTLTSNIRPLVKYLLDLESALRSFRLPAGRAGRATSNLGETPHKGISGKTLHAVISVEPSQMPKR